MGIKVALVGRPGRHLVWLPILVLLSCSPGPVQADDNTRSRSRQLLDELKTRNLRLSSARSTEQPSAAESFQFEFHFGSDTKSTRRVVVETNGNESAFLYTFADGVPICYSRAKLTLMIAQRPLPHWSVVGNHGFEFNCVKASSKTFGVFELKPLKGSATDNVTLNLGPLFAMYLQGESPFAWSCPFGDCDLLGTRPSGSRVRIDFAPDVFLAEVDGGLFPIRRFYARSREGEGVAFCRCQVQREPLRSILSFNADSYAALLQEPGTSLELVGPNDSAHFDPRISTETENDKAIRAVGLALLKQFPPRFDVVEDVVTIDGLKSAATDWDAGQPVNAAELKRVHALLLKLLFPSKRKSAAEKWSPTFDRDEPYLRLEIACGPDATVAVVRKVGELLLDPKQDQGVRAEAIAFLSEIGPPVASTLMQDAAKAFSNEDRIPKQLLYLHSSLQARYGEPTERYVELLREGIKDASIDRTERVEFLVSLGVLGRVDIDNPLLSDLLQTAGKTRGRALELSRALSMNGSGQAALVRLIESTDVPAPRDDMLTALSEYACPPVSAWRDVLRLAEKHLLDENASERLRAAAFVIVCRKDQQPAEVKRRIQHAIGTGLPLVSTWAFEEIRRRKSGFQFLPEIAQGLETDSKYVQYSAAYALLEACIDAKPGAIPDGALRMTEGMLAHENSEVRVAALRALGKLAARGMAIDAATKQTVVANAIQTDDLMEMMVAVSLFDLTTPGKLAINFPRQANLSLRLDRDAMDWWMQHHPQVRTRLKEIAAELKRNSQAPGQQRK